MNIEDVQKYGKRFAGRTQLIKYLKGEKITRSESMAAKCYSCQNGYADGRNDCLVFHCPIYPFTAYTSRPYAKDKKKVEVMRKRHIDGILNK